MQSGEQLKLELGLRFIFADLEQAKAEACVLNGRVLDPASFDEDVSRNWRAT